VPLSPASAPGLGNAGLGNAGLENAGLENAGLENASLENAGLGDRGRWLAARRTDARWAREYAMPWLRRRLAGASSGDGLSAKRPDLLSVARRGDGDARPL
jgi:hypothetical protein